MKVDPVEGVLAVLGDGAATGSNKFALLLALIDLAPSVTDEDSLGVDDIARKLLELHWDHPRPFNGQVLRQVVSGNRANSTAVLEVQRLQQRWDCSVVPPFAMARNVLDQQDWEGAVKSVAAATAKNPLRLLQTVNGQQISFLYEVVGPSVRFLPGAISALVRYGPLLRELVEFRYVKFVARANTKTNQPSLEDRVAEHLFGAERFMPPVPLRHQLWELQEHVCIYTGQPIDDPLLLTGNSSVDHVVPWSRARISDIENFVLTTRSVNSAKGNLLLAPGLVERWSIHLEKNGDALGALASRFGWPTDRRRVINDVTAFYRHGGNSAVVWDGMGGPLTLNTEHLESVLQVLDRMLTSSGRP
jgi:5-methylcytosine-specific restriction endonuclease McrA